MNIQTRDLTLDIDELLLDRSARRAVYIIEKL